MKKFLKWNLLVDYPKVMKKHSQKTTIRFFQMTISLRGMTRNFSGQGVKVSWNKGTSLNISSTTTHKGPNGKILKFHLSATPLAIF